MGMSPGNEKWEAAVMRAGKLPEKANEIRTEFARDVTRLLHCTAYRRLKHKTQVFFAPANDHICTRIEHVNHVASISYTIAKYLGLNTELTHAIALGHDIGHAPFGHAGETVIKDIVKRYCCDSESRHNMFWHEKNSLYFIDNIETLEGPDGFHRNLDLTYAVRDGIVSHCGEIDENGLYPRKEAVDLESIKRPNEFSPYTWEGCVVKIADKIAYIGRDIEDALILDILSRKELRQLAEILEHSGRKKMKEINNTVVIHESIIDLCRESSPERGISLSQTSFETLNALKEFNYKHIYYSAALKPYKKYAELIINLIFDVLHDFYDADTEKMFASMRGQRERYPLLTGTFMEWLEKYGEQDITRRENSYYKNRVIYNPGKQSDYSQAIIDFISGMTDTFAKRVFEELITF